jgi:hypothetical protein
MPCRALAWGVRVPAARSAAAAEEHHRRVAVGGWQGALVLGVAAVASEAVVTHSDTPDLVHEVPCHALLAARY